MVRGLKVQLEELKDEIDEREYEKGEMGEVLEEMKKSFKDKDALKDKGTRAGVTALTSRRLAAPTRAGSRRRRAPRRRRCGKR